MGSVAVGIRSLRRRRVESVQPYTADEVCSAFKKRSNAAGPTMSELKALTVQTANFGEIEVPVESVIHFSEGIPGFPKIHNFAILEFEHLKPFQYLQSLDDPPIALLVTNPFLFDPKYRVDLEDSDMEDLSAKETQDVSVYAVATIPANPSEATLNLMAPILINPKHRRGKQIILLDSQYPMRFPLFGSSECHSAETV